MNPDRWPEVERLYEQVVALPVAERGAFLDAVCAGDDEVRREVEGLLNLEPEAKGFLEQPALRAAANSLSRALPHLKPPDVPGYRIIRELGEGGMGVVYLAEQLEPLRRSVALKLIRPGMDSRQVLARFERERQALARMDHPNIAVVFDAGSTADGRPYFVMEFVDGLPITEYCDRRNLSIRARLSLFIQVCNAVQHAHQKGVIHRDLKPSNVLVMDQVGQHVPKVIDFGTAKAADPTGEAVTIRTEGLVFGTVEYMSPEQAALSADIDTATDVYSLGVLLYELLAGRLPFDMDELRTAGYDEIRRVIRESDPPKPSIRVEQRTSSSEKVARTRQTDGPGLTRQLRGDLDWITLKALEKDRLRRYATVAAFATDIERFLGDQPVEARPPSSTYRIRKFTRRHRLVVASAAIIITILAVGVMATTGLYWRSERERREADQQRQDATEQREQAVAQRSAAEHATAEANEQRARAVRAQADAETQRSRALSALQESSYLAYVNALAAAAGDLRSGSVGDARARLLTIGETQRGWEWHHLFIQTDNSISSFSTAAQSCGSPSSPYGMPTLSLGADGESILVRRCKTLERWNVTTFAHGAWEAPSTILADNPRGHIVTQHRYSSKEIEYRTERLSLGEVQNDPSQSTPKVLGPFESQPVCADISPDDTRIALGLNRSLGLLNGSDVFEVWNIATGRLEHRLVAAPPALRTSDSNSCMVRFSPDGRHVATSGATVHVWDAGTGARRALDSVQAGVIRQAIAFSRDGNRLAIGRPSGLVDVLDLGQPTPILMRLSRDEPIVDDSIPNRDQALLLRNRAAMAVTFSPDDQTIISCASITVAVWDIKQARRVRVLSGHAADVMDVITSRDGRQIYSIDVAGVVRMWSASSVPAVLRLMGSVPNLNPFAVNSDGTVIVSIRAGELTATRLTDVQLESVQPSRYDGRMYTFRTATISPDGLRLFAVEGWDTVPFGPSNGHLMRSWTIGSTESTSVPIRTLVSTNDASRSPVPTSRPQQSLQSVEDLQRQADELVRQQNDVVQRVADLDTGLDKAAIDRRAQQLRQLSQEKDEMRAKVANIERQLEGLSQQALGSKRPDVARRMQDAALSIRDDMLKSKIDFSRMAMSGGSEFSTPIERELVADIGRLRQTIGEAANSADAPQEHIEKTAGRQGQQGQADGRVRGTEGFVAAPQVKWLTVSPSGALLALSYGSYVAIWDALAMKQLVEVNLAKAVMNQVFRDEETLVISTGASNAPSSVLIWNWRANRVLAKAQPTLDDGVAGDGWRLVLSPDGRRIAMISFKYARLDILAAPIRKSVRIWDRELKAEIGRLPLGDYQAFSFSRDSRRIVTVGAEETVVRVWDAERLLPLLTLDDSDSHRGGVAFTQDGRIVAGRSGGGLTIWDSQIRRR